MKYATTFARARLDCTMPDKDARVVVVRSDVVVTAEDLNNLLRFPVIIEGGIAQGKTSLARALARFLRKCGMQTMCCPEPTDEEALAEFMKFQGAPPTDEAERAAFQQGRIAAAVRLQRSMMTRRTDVVRNAAEFAKTGIPIIDRGPFGDTTFMTSTYRAYGVPADEENGYIIKFLSDYLRIPFPRRTPFLILRVRAPVAITHARYLEREKLTPGNKYTPEYMQGIEDAHDACARAWGPYVLYDNSDVAYIRPTSPIDEEGRKAHGSPDENAVKSVVRALCDLAKELN